MWMSWLPWRFIVKHAAHKGGFLNPLDVMYRLQQFSQPSEVVAPLELLRSGAVIHARGLINSQAIQHNLDWVWPYWVECQFNPKSASFIPRAFSITHINLTHRNWTAVGFPDYASLPIVDPRGLLTPFHDGWSLDAWIMHTDKAVGPLIPARLPHVEQGVNFEYTFSVRTLAGDAQALLHSTVEVKQEDGTFVCQLEVEGQSKRDDSWLVVALRPYNPEGISFIHDIDLLEKGNGWRVNNKYPVYWNYRPDQHIFSYYRHGDVFSKLPYCDDWKKVHCKVGMATAAAQFKLDAYQSKKIIISVPLENTPIFFKNTCRQNKAEVVSDSRIMRGSWQKSLEGLCQIDIPDEKFKFLYDVALRTFILHSPHEIYPGPYTYKRFWFRDAAFILYAMLCVGFKARVKRTIDLFPSKQTHGGYFLSQEGEWDSNGEALWIMGKFCKMTNSTIPRAWHKPIERAGRWIMHKLLKSEMQALHAGLFPSGFSAEHLGPNDYYYWDDFWGVAGLNAAGYLMRLCHDENTEQRFISAAQGLMRAIECSLLKVNQRLAQAVIPAAPYRRMDAGAIGSIVADYPLQLLPVNDKRIKNTSEFLMQYCFEGGGFFQDMTHSGINPYLTLHIAQVLLRSGDRKYFDLIQVVADLSSVTGQWPEAVHPLTRGGCMGDGQHVWASAEWVMMLRNCFVREEVVEGRLILCSGIPQVWIETKQKMSFGPARTVFGEISIVIEPAIDMIHVHWTAAWFDGAPQIEVCLPGFKPVVVAHQQQSVQIKMG